MSCHVSCICHAYIYTCVYHGGVLVAFISAIIGLYECYESLYKVLLFIVMKTIHLNSKTKYFRTQFLIKFYNFKIKYYYSYSP